MQQVNNASVLVGTQNKRLIALYFKRNINLIIALLAVLKIDSAYVPLDPKNPIARNQLILEDANVKYYSL